MKESYYQEHIHTWGRFSLALALFLFILYPLAVCVIFQAWPGWGPILRGLLGIAPVYWTVGAIEALTFGPMLGSGGAYLGFVTGNLTAMKVPVALRALQVAGVESNTEEGEVLSTLAIAASSLTTTFILFLGMLLLRALQPILTSDLLAPAFANILPALFGALGVVFIAKNPKLAVAPLTLMFLLFSLAPALTSAVSVLVPLSSLIALGAARWMYRRKWLD